MTTEREAVVNKALSGIELRELLLRDFIKLLDSDGMLTNQTAYGRCAYDIRLRIHVDNTMQRQHESAIGSRGEARNKMDKQPSLAAVEKAPLVAPSPESIATGTELSRNITSPNAERLNAGLPLTVDTREQDGSKVQKLVTYPQPEAGEVAVDVTVKDTTTQVRKDWDLQPLVPIPASAHKTLVAEKPAGVKS